jgi:hypothetical protein
MAAFIRAHVRDELIKKMNIFTNACRCRGGR